MGWLTKGIDWLVFWLFRRVKIRGLLRRLRLELNKAYDLARTYLSTTDAGRENTPSYRCATGAYDKGADLLVGFDVFDSDGLDKVISAYDNIVDFNRCLQFVHEAVDTPRFSQQVDRARVKAKNVQRSVPLAITVVGDTLRRYE